MAAIKLLLGVFCIALTYSNAKPGSSLLTDSQDAKSRKTITDIAAKEIGVRELSNNNDGARVEAYLAYTGLKKGSPWCASFISWVYKNAGYSAPRSAWSPDLLPRSRLTKTPLPGDVFGVYFPNLKRIAHVGIVERIDGDWCVGLEGNTNINGSRNGDGVYRKRRPLKSIYQVADWFTPKKGKS